MPPVYSWPPNRCTNLSCLDTLYFPKSWRNSCIVNTAHTPSVVRVVDSRFQLTCLHTAHPTLHSQEKSRFAALSAQVERTSRENAVLLQELANAKELAKEKAPAPVAPPASVTPMPREIVPELSRQQVKTKVAFVVGGGYKNNKGVDKSCMVWRSRGDSRGRALS